MKRIPIIDVAKSSATDSRKILNQQLDHKTFSEAGSVAEAVKLVVEQNWDLVILDRSRSG